VSENREREREREIIARAFDEAETKANQLKFVGLMREMRAEAHRPKIANPTDACHPSCLSNEPRASQKQKKKKKSLK
jgi:hypothetical protein